MIQLTNERDIIIPNPTTAKLLTSTGESMSRVQTKLFMDYSKGRLRAVVRESYEIKTDTEQSLYYNFYLDKYCKLMNFHVQTGKKTIYYPGFNIAIPFDGLHWLVDLGSNNLKQTIDIEYAYYLYVKMSKDNSVVLCMDGVPTIGSSLTDKNDLMTECDRLIFVLRKVSDKCRIDHSDLYITDHNDKLIWLYPNYVRVIASAAEECFHSNIPRIKSGEITSPQAYDNMPSVKNSIFSYGFRFNLEIYPIALGEGCEKPRTVDFFSMARALGLDLPSFFLHYFCKNP
ncbi:MAG: hypothetical protein LBE27_03210 [Deltaproteobacteria bacterium]|jgi:hypothetical protein|nr:hypothetical protein [Deltaproteobacteria bacterium]